MVSTLTVDNHENEYKKGGAHTDQPRFAEHSTDTPKMKTIPALISEIVCEMLQKRPN